MNEISNKRHLTQTVRLALPLIIGQISVVAMSFVDTIMAGRLSAVTLAAVAVGSSIWATAILFMMGILMAIPPLVSSLDGAKKHHEIGPLMRQFMWLALLLGGVFFFVVRALHPLLLLFDTKPEVVPHAVGYIDAISWGVLPLALFLTFRYLADGLSITKTTMYISFLGLLLNIPFNYVLIYGHLGFPALGAAGCGYATSAVIAIQMLVFAAVTHRHPRIARVMLFGRFEKPDWAEIRRVLRMGLPIGLSMFAEVGFFAAVTLLSSSLSTDTVAAHQIALNIISLLFMVPLGLSMAMTIRVGNAVGRKRLVDIRRAGWLGMALVLGTQAFSAALVLLFPEHITALYTGDQAVAGIAVRLLFLAALFQLSDGLQVAAAGALRGIKDLNFIMYSNVFSFWALGFLASWFLCFQLGHGAVGLWIGMIVGLTSAAVLNVARFAAMTRSKDKIKGL